ncbi:MAG: DUF2115 family protein [Methanocorpusculum sp.]|nr:DUF2115 family protein [Methanocorpusculum sp.]
MVNLTQCPKNDALAFIGTVSSALENETDGRLAVSQIAAAISQYTTLDLQYIGGHLRLEVEKLPNPYKNVYKPFSQDLIRQHAAFFADLRAGSAPETIADPVLWKEYWSGAAAACLASEAAISSAPRPEFDSLSAKFFYRLVYGYAMLLKGEPGHPVGMPFPGGLKIRVEGSEIYCPIRDKEKDLPQALCNFCPAKQDPHYA